MAKRRGSGRSPRVSVTLTEEEARALKVIADEEKRSDSFMAAEAIRFWLRHQVGKYPDLTGQTSLDFDTAKDPNHEPT